MRKLFVAIFVLLWSHLSYAQDLNRLQDRAKNFWRLRVAGNKLEAANYVEPSGRSTFVAFTEPPFIEAEVTGIELSPDPKLVYVVVRARNSLPEVKEVHRTVREPWVWTGKDWFFRVEQPTNLFSGGKNAPLAPPPAEIEFEFTKSEFDFGGHVQGAVIQGSIPFTGNREEIVLITPDDLPGFTFEPARWENNERGELKFTLDTALIPTDIKQKVGVQISDPSTNRRKKVFADMTAQVEARIRFRQFPEQIDPAKAGELELEIENLTPTPLHLRSLTVGNPMYKLDPNPPETINPGQAIRIKVAYDAQPDPLGAVLNLSFVEEVLGRKTIVLPLNVKLPFLVAPEITREQIEELIRKLPKP